MRIRPGQAAYFRVYYRDHRDEFAASFRLRRYGLTPEQYRDRLAAQGGLCAICRQPEVSRYSTGALKALCVDHDHACCPGQRSCGRCIRGLLCNSCNRGLGRMREDPELLRAAAAYLERPRCE